MDAAACERLAASLELPNAKVTLAQPVTSRQFAPPRPGARAPLLLRSRICRRSAASP